MIKIMMIGLVTVPSDVDGRFWALLTQFFLLLFYEQLQMGWNRVVCVRMSPMKNFLVSYKV